MELADLWRGRLSVRRASVLAMHLPPDARVKATGWDDYGWSKTTQEIVNLHDQVRAAIDKNARRLPRPGDSGRMAARADRAFAKAARFLWRKRQMGV